MGETCTLVGAESYTKNSADTWMIQSWYRENDAVVLVTRDGRILLKAISEKIIHCIYTQRDEFSTKSSLMVQPQTARAAELNVVEGNGHTCFHTLNIHLVVDKASGAFTWYDEVGNLLVREPYGGGKVLEETIVEKHVYGVGAAVRTEATVDGLKSRSDASKTVVDRTAYTTRLSLVFSPDEAIYGLGQHEEGILNYRGHTQYLYQQNMKVAMPVIVSSRGYGIFWDTNGLAVFHDDQHGSYFWTDVDDEMDFYFIAGPEFDDIVAGMRALTGAPSMLPRWAYGYVQSKERYKSQDELVEIAREYRQRNIPLDCIVLDWMSWSGQLWGQKTLDPERFPDPARLTDDLHAENVKLMVSIWPIFANNGANHVEMREAGFLLGNDSTYNAFDPDARALYWKQANEGLFSKGMDAWWCDCSEPFEADWNGAIKPEPFKRVQINVGEAKRYLDPEYINAYSLLHSKGIYDGQRGEQSSKRVINLTRSGFPGQQRYGTITWSGDTAANWDTLRRQIADGLNFCVTGNPRWTFDVGAFFVGRKEQWFWNGSFPNGCVDPAYRELYLRWMQVGAFLPMFRSHGTDTPREVWRFGKPGEAIYDALVRSIELRYRLIPYIYSVAAQETHDNYTMMRMLAFDFRHDPEVYNIADQFMFGPSLMICPVLHPAVTGEAQNESADLRPTRDVYLPLGADWIDFWTGECFIGGQRIEIESDFATTPIYVRTGSVIPLAPLSQSTSAIGGSTLEVRIYGGTDGSFKLYDDENDGYGYEQRAYSTQTLEWRDQSETLAISELNGQYPGMQILRNWNVVRVREGHGVGAQEELSPDLVVRCTGGRFTILDGAASGQE